MKQITVELDEILDLVVCAEDYGHNNQVLMHTFRNWVVTLSKKEIEEYVDRAFLSEKARSQGYGEEDAERAREVLTRWVR